MSLRAGAAVVAVAMLLAACTSDDDGAADPEPANDNSTPTPDPATDVDLGGTEELARFYDQQLSWAECDEFECATLEVPLDYEDPDGETIELALLRDPTDSDDRIGSLIVNPGGPGASGVTYAESPGIVSDDVRNRFDIVGFDPRGVGASAPIDCLDDAELDELVAIDGAPADEADLDVLIEQYEQLATGCEVRSGDLLPHVGTANVARDLDVLRAVLGDESLYYLGKSYGTYIGALYADEFPDRVGRLVLDGAVDPSLTGEEFALGQAAGVERALTAYLSSCIERGDCPLGDSEQVARETLAGLLDVTADDPLPTDDEARPLTQSLATLGIILPLYIPPEEGYELLTAALAEALAGNGEVLLYLADVYLDRNEDGTYNGNQNEVIFAVHCVDRPDVSDLDEVEASLAEFEAASPIFGPFLAWGGHACGEWPAPPTGTPAPVTAAGAAPILVVGTTGDLATPYEWAESLADQLESGVLLTYEGAGHLAYRSAGSSCVDDVVDTYLLDGQLPDDEAALTCS